MDNKILSKIHSTFHEFVGIQQTSYVFSYLILTFVDVVWCKANNTHIITQYFFVRKQNHTYTHQLELRQSRQSLAAASDRMSRASYAGSGIHGAAAAAHSVVSSRRARPRSRSRDHMNGAHHIHSHHRPSSRYDYHYYYHLLLLLLWFTTFPFCFWYFFFDQQPIFVSKLLILFCFTIERRRDIFDLSHFVFSRYFFLFAHLNHLIESFSNCNLYCNKFFGILLFLPPSFYRYFPMRWQKSISKF